jgi:hypothetical protein
MKATLKISQGAKAAETHAKLTLGACVALLSELKVASTAFYTLSAVADEEGHWQAEQGVCIDVYGVDKEKICEELWPRLQKDYGLDCIHVHELGHGFNGCIFDWMRETACPASVRRKALEGRSAALAAQSDTPTPPPGDGSSALASPPRLAAEKA